MEELRRTIKRAPSISVAGGRHSMGAQAFGTDTVHFDLTGVQSIHDLDTDAGIVEADPGVTWPVLMEVLEKRQAGIETPWCIIQKQTGADDLTLGGAIASNIHGRGLRFAPFVQDVDSFTLLTASGDEIHCSRHENSDWFRLAIGGYGVFGVVTSLRLRLMRRTVVRREVQLTQLDHIPSLVEQRIAEDCLYGDFQFSTAPESEGFLREGVFSVYRPVTAEPLSSASPASNDKLSPEQWKHLIVLAHTDKRRAFKTYTDYYRTTNGQLYASDRQQMSTYLPDYHEVIAEATGGSPQQSLVITELYVPRNDLVTFFDEVRQDMLRFKMDLVYGVVRWIEEDAETFLPWARQPYACVIFNLNVRHNEAGRFKARSDFRRLIDRALAHGGSYYLTYHRHARREQIEAAHPRFAEMLAEKEARDPKGIWNSDWYRHHRKLFSTT